MSHWSKPKKYSKRPTEMTIFFRFQLLYCLEKLMLWNKRCKMIKAGKQKEKKCEMWVNLVQLENYSMLFIKMPLEMWQQRPLFNNWLNFKTSSDYRWVYFADKYFATKCTDCHFSMKLTEASIYEVPGRPPYCETRISGACQTSHALHASLGNQIWYRKIERHLQKKKRKKTGWQSWCKNSEIIYRPSLLIQNNILARMRCCWTLLPNAFII